MTRYALTLGALILASIVSVEAVALFGLLVLVGVVMS